MSRKKEREIFGSRETVDMAETVGISKRVDKKRERIDRRETVDMVETVVKKEIKRQIFGSRETVQRRQTVGRIQADSWH